MWGADGRQEREGLREGQQDSSTWRTRRVYRKGAKQWSFRSCKDSVESETEISFWKPAVYAGASLMLPWQWPPSHPREPVSPGWR